MIADLCLVLLLDASGSVDAAEWELQARATAEALSSPAIVEQVLRGPHGRIAVAAMEWSGAALEILPWTTIASAGDAARVAAALQAYQRRQSGSTAVGDALVAAGSMFHQGVAGRPVACGRQVVDISSDGASNAGQSPAGAVAFLQAMDVQVNAIVIQPADADPSANSGLPPGSTGGEIGVLEFYEKTVSGFVLEASWEGYAEAIRRKLALEIAGYPELRKRSFPVDHSLPLARSTCGPWLTPGCARQAEIAYEPWLLGHAPSPEAPLALYPTGPLPDGAIAPVPAPGAALLLGLGLAGLILFRRKR